VCSLYAGGYGGWTLFARDAGRAGRDELCALCMLHPVEGGLGSLEVLEVMRCGSAGWRNNGWAQFRNFETSIVGVVAVFCGVVRRVLQSCRTCQEMMDSIPSVLLA